MKGAALSAALNIDIPKRAIGSDGLKCHHRGRCSHHGKGADVLLHGGGCCGYTALMLESFPTDSFAPAADFPPLSVEILTLLGISQAGYVTNKAVPRPVAAKMREFVPCGTGPRNS